MILNRVLLSLFKIVTPVMFIFILKSHASLASHNQDVKISVIGADHKKRVIIDDNTYTLSEPTIFQGPGRDKQLIRFGICSFN